MFYLSDLSGNQRNHLLQGLAFLSRIFWGPEPKTCAEIACGSSLQWSSQLAPLLDPTFSETMAELKSIIEDHGNDDSLFRYLDGVFIRLFVNARDGIPTPLYQSCYEMEHASLMGPPAVNMKKRLECAGLSMAEEVDEPPDHLSVQIEYLYFLLEKGFREEDRNIIADASAFVAETMLPWVAKLNYKLSAETEGPFYSSMVSALLCILEFIGRLNPQNKP